MKLQQKMIITLVMALVFIQLFSGYFSIEGNIYKEKYMILLLAYLTCVPLFLITIFKKNYYIFEPYTLVSLLYIAIMIYRPCIDLINEKYYQLGAYVFGGCTKGTLIFILAFYIFTFSYNIKLKINNNKKESCQEYRESKTLKEYSFEYSKKVRSICIIIFIMGFLGAILYYYTANYNPLLFIFNENVSIKSTLFDSDYKFLMKITYLMIIPWLYFMRFEKKIWIRILTSLLMFFVFLVRGSRIILVLCILSYIILPYISEKKGFPFKKAAVLFMILLIFCDIIAFTRVSSRFGKAVDFDSMKAIVEITDVFDSDLTIYRQYYCIVEKIPSHMNYQHGKGIFVYSFVSFFPKVLFPWKDNYNIMPSVIETTMNEQNKMSGVAPINIAEFYLEFGILGCIIFMYLFGIICRKLKLLYMKKDCGLNELILYSVLFTFLMQIVCRGDLAPQLNSLLFITLPYFVIRFFNSKRIVVSR